MPRRVYCSLREILAKDMPHGGVAVMATGKPGAGKTTLLIGIARRLIDSELCIFRGMKTGQAFRFPGHLKILAYQCKPKFHDQKGNPIKTKVTVAKTFDEVLTKTELGKLNVLYMPFQNEVRCWIEFSRFLIGRFPAKYASIFISLFFDEFEDLAPKPSSSTAKDTAEFTEQMRDFRKTFVSFYCATQQYFDIHWWPRGKINYMVYLKGAFIPRTEKRVKQGLIDNLKLGQGIISGSFFSPFTFRNYPPKKVVVVR